MSVCIKSTPEGKKLIFNAIKAKIIKHLEELEAEESGELKKTFSELKGLLLKGGKGLPVGTVREWKGKKFIKVGPGKWKPKYESETRGAKLAISALKKKIELCEDEREMMALVLENRDRFSDKNGYPLPFVQQLSEFISQTQEKRAGSSGKEKSATAGGGDDGGNNKENRNNILRSELKIALKPFINKDIENNATKIIARISSEGTNKMGSSKAINKSKKNGFTVDEHFEVAKQIIELYKKAQLVHTGQDEKITDNPNILSIKRFVAETQLNSGKQADALITVKESKEAGHRIYSIELDEIKTASTRWQADTSGTPPNQGTATTEATPTVPQSAKKVKSGIEKIKAQYTAKRQITGDEDEIYVGDKTFTGTWKLVEAEAPSASHDEKTFRKTEGFPENKDGSTINDRDYENDKAAQLAVLNVAGNYDGRALSFDTPVVVTADGVVISGNNRTMSSKLAAEKGTDKAYIEALKKRAKKFGFSQKDLEGFKHPRVVFEIENDGAYSTDQFAQFNVSETKTMNPIEQAVKVSKIIKAETVKEAAAIIGDFETMGELYADSKAVSGMFDTFEKSGIINQFTRPQYENEGVITGAGKEFVETVLIGSVVNEKNIRGLTREGCKNIRRKLVRAITPLINNKSMGGYSITDELNEAVDIIMQVNINKDKFKSVEEFAAQGSMFEDKNTVAIELAKKLENKEKEFADFMQGMNAALEPGASGQADIFFGDVETKDAVLKRMLNLKKSLSAIFSQSLATLQSFYEDKLKEYIVKAFTEAEHLRDERGRFTNKGENSITETEAEHTLSNKELKNAVFDYAREHFQDKHYINRATQEAIYVTRNGLDEWYSKTKSREQILSLKILDRLLESAHYDAETDDNKNRSDIEKVKYYSSACEINGKKYTAKITIRLTSDNKNRYYHHFLQDIQIKPESGMLESTDKQSNPPLFSGSEFSIPQFNENVNGDTFEKSLTYSGYPLEGRTNIHGMDISIENKKGSVRSGVDKDGHEWAIKMAYDYGYIRGTVGKDKDHVDAYIGNNPESEKVFVIHQNDPTTGKYDEDKVMLGFNSAKEAKAAYLRQYDRPGFFGEMIEMGIEEFKEKAFDKKNKGKMIA
ncbi:hypothetical protein [Treponema pedis]|uniref:LPD3 domain-containing protein n=1 Tax=Treponema pedis TaxID=409322 RepID=UPI003D1D91B3